MPLPVAAGALYAGAAAAGKHLVFHAAPLFDLTTLTSATIGVWIFRYIWKNKVPRWVKEDVSIRNLLMRKPSEQEKDPKTLSASEREELEMSGLSSVLEKLQALVNSVQLEEDYPSTLQQHAALLAYMQLAAQVKREEQLGKRKHCQTDPTGEREEKDRNEESEVEAWASRDALYESARSSAEFSDGQSHYSKYYDFARHPNQSPTKTTLQRALRLATYAYYDNPEILSDKLACEEDCSLLEHSLETSRPGVVAYYVAVSSISNKQLIVGIRGTSSVEDIVTDICGRSVPLDDRTYYYDCNRGRRQNPTNSFVEPSRIEVLAATANKVVQNDDDEVEVISGHERVFVEQGSTLSNSTVGAKKSGYELLHCHEGIMVSAKRLVDAIQKQVEYWVLERGYQLVIAGHSLGSGVAILAAVLLRSRLPELIQETKITAISRGELPPSKMHVYCFAPPPVLDRDAALATSSYCTSIVCNADMIPRCSMENLLIFLEVLKGIWKELERIGWAPTGPKTTAAFFQRIAKGSEAEMLMTAPALRSLMAASMKKIQFNAESKRVNVENQSIKSMNDLSPPSSAAFCDKRWDQSTGGFSNREGEMVSQLDEQHHPHLYIPGVVLLGYEPWQGSLSAAANLDTGNAHEEDSPSQMSWTVTDGSADVFRFLEMGASSRMFTDHTTTSYYSLLDMEYQF